MTFTVEVESPNGSESGAFRIELYLDNDALEMFIDVLKQLKDGRLSDHDHEHFMTESWQDGGDLTQEAQGKGNVLCHHLKVCRID